MKAFPRRARDQAMQIICDYYADANQPWPLDTNELYDRGLSKDINAEQLACTLEAMGYIELTRYYDDPSAISLTNSGKCYFETNADRLHEKRIENIRYIITTAIAVIALIKSFLPEILEALGRILPPA